MKRTITVFVLLAILVMSIVPAFTVSAQDPLIESVCFVSDTGRINDGGFNQSAYEGMLRAAEDFGLENKFIETQSQADYATNINTCLSEGFDAVLTVGFLIADATLAAATENPEVYFIGIDQFFAEAPANLVGIQYREDQAGFLAGALAAQMTTSGTVAGVYGIDIPPVKKFRNGFEQGAAYINPEIEVLGVYIDNFDAADRGAAAAEQFIGEGADVIFGAGGGTGNGAITYAAQNGLLVIGVDQDQYATVFGNGETPGAENLISSALKRVDQGAYLPLEALVNGDTSYFGGVTVLTAAEEGVGFAPAHDSAVPEEVTAAMDEILAGLADGSIQTGVDFVSGELLGSIADIVVASATGDAPEFTVLLAAVEAAGLTETLAGEGPFTVFAPTDAAFVAALEALGVTAEELLADTELLTAVLTYHVVPGYVTAADVVGMGSGPVTTVNGADIEVTVGEDGSVMVNNANVVAVDVLASNGVIHVIDAVLLPPAE